MPSCLQINQPKTSCPSVITLLIVIYDAASTKIHYLYLSSSSNKTQQSSVLAVPNPFFISELLLAYESNREKMGQASRITGLSAGLLEFTDHIRMSPVPYGTTCPGHQESYVDASILHSRNLDPNCDKCFKCMY